MVARRITVQTHKPQNNTRVARLLKFLHHTVVHSEESCYKDKNMIIIKPESLLKYLSSKGNDTVSISPSQK